MSDLFQDAQQDLNEQAKWGENLTTRALRKALIVIRTIGGRVKQLEDRVTALENRNP